MSKQMNNILSPDHACGLRPTWCEIDLDAIEHNFRTLKTIIGARTRVFASLKNNATGCGSIVVTRLLERLGADGVCFGNIDEAVAARQAGASIPILLYPNCLPQAAPTVSALNLSVTLSTLEDVEAWNNAAPAGTKISVFLKLDGGGLRAGALPSHAVEIARAIAGSNRLMLEGAYGHPMATYDKSDAAFTRAQLVTTIESCRAIEASGIRLPIRMVASSSILVGHTDMDLDAVDPGRLLFGSIFDAVPERERIWRPAIVGLKSRLVMRKPLDSLGGITHANYFPVRPQMILGLIPFGWGDGYPRKLPEGASALIRGRRVSLLGPPHSESLRVDLTDVPDASLGDEVVLLGRSEDAEITPAEISRQWGLSLDDFYARLPAHLSRRYFQAAESVN